MSKSIEEKIEDNAKNQLRQFGIKYYTKTDSINSEIDDALKKSVSKSGGNGGNYPDIKVLLPMPGNRPLPVMIEVKGTKGRLIKANDKGDVFNLTDKGEPNYTNIKNYAVNGAVHYTESIINYSRSYHDGIAIGINGYESSANNISTEYGVYFVSSENFLLPKKIAEYTDLSFLQDSNLEKLQRRIEDIYITDEEKENRSHDFENQIETALQHLNQNMHDNLNSNFAYAKHL
ncbi:MAG: hypothetical protein ACI4OA_08640 [Selenomonadaceae bacterium]